MISDFSVQAGFAKKATRCVEHRFSDGQGLHNLINYLTVNKLDGPPSI